jgi:hypothetical protein
MGGRWEACGRVVPEGEPQVLRARQGLLRGCAGKWPRMMVELGACPDCGESFEAEGGCRDRE